MIRALLFDFDGLLVDTETPRYQAWRELYAEHGHEIPLERWREEVGTIGAFDPLAYLVDLGAVFDRDSVTERRRRRRDELCAAQELAAGVASYLDEAEQRGLAKAIVTSGAREWVLGHLERLGADARWDLIVTAEGDRERAKPTPTLYLEALAGLGIEADEAIAFEDSVNGVRAAKAAGVFVVAVPNSVTREFDLSEADLVAESLAELPLDDLLERVEAARSAGVSPPSG